MFSLRIVTTSHYQAAPIPGLDTTTSEFRSSSIKRVPVLRIFGSTPAGQKTCMHVHGVFPYLYVPYDGTQPADRYLRQFAASLDKALNVASRSASANQQHVYKISIVSGIPMYGYHPEEEQFLKIYLYNPNNVRKAADLMLGGAVMNKPFQPHESHIPYPLQLFIDYNLYGMNLINVAALKFRRKKKDGESDDQGKSSSICAHQSNISSSLLTSSSSSSSLQPSLAENHIWNEENVPSELLLPADVEKQSVCELEVDVVAADITNRQEITNSIGANPGLTALWEDERQRRRDAGESSQLEPEPSQERHEVLPSESETDLLQKFLTIVKEQQAFRDSQSEDSQLSQSALLASQLERHLSREDSRSSSEGTVILEDNETNETTSGEKDDVNQPIISLESIKKVISFSQSFTDNASQKDSQDHSVADILASLLEEAGPPSSQISSLEDKDSVLNQSTIRDEEVDKEVEEESLLMSQSFCQEEKDEGLAFEPGKPQKSWPGIEDDDIVMGTDEEDDDIDILPQFDGASDDITGTKKKTDKAQSIGDTSNQSSFLSESSQLAPRQTPVDSSLGSNQNMNQWGGDTSQGQGYSSDMNPGYTHQQQGQSVWPGQAAGNWQGQSPMWQQQQRFQNWSPQHQQQAPAYNQRQLPYRASPPFHSPPHNSFSSPSHQSPGFQTPSPSIGPHRSPFQYPGYQSQSPSSQPQYTGQAYQSPYQSPNSNNHSYHQSPQPYQSPSTPGSQSYQSPLPYTSKPLPGGAPYQSPGYQSSPGSQLYQSPTSSNPYHSVSSNGTQMYQPPYQSPQQTYPPPYQSPKYPSQQQPGWSPHRDYSGYFPAHSNPQQQSSHSNMAPGLSQHAPSVGGTRPVNTSSGSNYSGDPTSPQLNHPSNTNHSKHVSSSQSSSGHLENSSLMVTAQHKQEQESSTLSSQTVTGQSEMDASIYQHQGSENLSKQPDQLHAHQGKSDEFKSPHSISSCSSWPSSSKQTKELLKKPVPSQTASYARALPPPSTCSKPTQDGPQLLENCEATKSIHTAAEEKPHSSPTNKISTLNFKPTTSSSTTSGSILETGPEKPSVGVDVSATPMIQQLLMEESPAKKTIKAKDREAAAAMRKPMLSPSPPKAKKKSKSKTGPPGRPRSSSASSPIPSMDFRGGFSPQHTPMINQHQLQGRTGRSHSITLPFNNDPRMVAPNQGYGWTRHPHVQPQQMQWHQGYPGWQQQQQQAQRQQQQCWGSGQWPNYSSPASYGNGGSAVCSPDASNYQPARVQNRSFSADAAKSPFYSGRQSLESDGHSSDQNNCVEKSDNSPWQQDSIGSEAQGNLSGDVKDTSSLSSLLQLVSDVGSSSDETGWDSVVSSGMSHPEPVNGNLDAYTNKSTPTSENTNQPSPLVKDFITLETPAKPSGNAADGNCESSEECDHMQDSVSENKTHGKAHPRLGKQNRLKRMGPKLSTTAVISIGDRASSSWTPPRRNDIGHVDSHSPNPWYTYTFHVPTPVFKKLKFYQSAQARKQTIKIVRMHPMDARRYSLLKIGREVVRVGRLTLQDLARYNVTFPPSSRYASPDGSSNRVNLNIPTGSGDSHNGDGSAEEGSCISFDTDFPPNKVAPPSSFDASHVTASVQRSVAQSSSRGSPRANSPAAATGVGSTGEWSRQYVAQQQQYALPAFNNEGVSPSRASTSPYPGQVPGFRSQIGDYPYSHQGPESGVSYPVHQQLPLGNTHSRNPSGGPSGFSPMYAGQNCNRSSSVSPSASGLQNPITYNTDYQASFMNNSSFPHPHHHHLQHSQLQQQHYQQSFQHHQQQYQFQHQHHPQPLQHQPQEDHNSSHLEQKNVLRSPGQHGLASNIDREGAQGHSGVERGEKCNHTPTTGILPVNSWVNAGINHAVQRADLDTINDEGNPTTLHSPPPLRFSSEISQHPSDDTANSCFKENSTGLPTDEADLYKKKKICRKKKRGCMSLKKKPDKKEIEELETLDSQDCSAHWDTDGEVVSAYFSQLKSSHTSNEGEARPKIVRKNVKSLRLKIPRPYSECTGNNESLDFAGEENRYPVSDSHEQLSDVSSSKTSEHMSGNRSSRVTPARVIRHGSRQAKLRSIYSSSPRIRQKQKRPRKKKKEPLKEGVHYIVIGKFKGHQSMLVKIKRVPVSRGEAVAADRYEQISSRDIVRQVVLAPSLERYSAELLTHESSPLSREDHSPDLCGKAVNEKPSRTDRQGKCRRKFRSAFAQAMAKKQHNTILNNSHPKNGEAGLMRVEASANSNTTVLSTGTFFSKLREAFLQHTQMLNPYSNESPPAKSLIFEGISLWQFSDFKRKLMKNLNGLRKEEYSSSSDDEEDVLDEEILQQKLHPHEVHKSKESSSIPSPQANILENIVTGDPLGRNASNNLYNQTVDATDLIKPSSRKEMAEEKTTLLGDNQSLKCDASFFAFNENDPLANTSLPMDKGFKKCEKDAKLESYEKQSHLATDASTMKNPHVEDNFLKRQMVFFEDISSTSESETEKEHVSPKCPPLRLSVGSNGIKILNASDHGPYKTSPDCKKFEPETVPISPEASAEEEDNVKEAEEFSAEHSESLDNLTDVDKKNLYTNLTSETLKMSLPSVKAQNSQPHADSLIKENRLADNKDEGGEQAVIDQVTESSPNFTSAITSEGEKTKTCSMATSEKVEKALPNNCEDFGVSLNEDPPFAQERKSKSLNGTLGSKSKLPKRTKKRGKNRKRSVRDKSAVSVSRSLLSNKESSSNDEAQQSEEKGSGFEKKRLRQRKQTSYRFYSEDIDSTDDEIWGIEGKDYNSVLSALNDSSKGKKAVPTLVDTGFPGSSKSSKVSASGSNSRRKKAPVGGGKLFNSLSLLHMATLANLTDAQQDSLDGNQSTSREATSTPTEQYSDKANGDCCCEYTPTLESLSFISPKTSEEARVSPPVASSPTDKKRQEQARAAEQSHASRRLFQSVHRRANLKPGCNGSSNLGTRPVHFNHLVNESASSSPVPSNFIFSDSNQAADPSATVSGSSGSSTNSIPVTTSTTTATSSTAVHQLLETRKAQVNCASFSMKDILRLATPDDSMDSDSKDSAAVVKPPEVRRAQVRSTSLSMNDILQLTSSTASPEESSALHHPLLAAAAPKKVVAGTGDEDELPKASSSLLKQLAEFEQPLPNATCSTHLEDEKQESKESVDESQAKHQSKSSSNAFEEKEMGKGACSQIKKDMMQIKSSENCQQRGPELREQEQNVSDRNKTVPQETSPECDKSLSSQVNMVSALKATVSASNTKNGTISPQLSGPTLETVPKTTLQCVLSEATVVPGASNCNKAFDPSKCYDETDGGINKMDSKDLSTPELSQSKVMLKANEKSFSHVYTTTASVVQPSYSFTSNLPKISVTCEDQEFESCNRDKRLGSQISPHQRGQGRELNPLHPLQIPSYPYLAWPPVHPYPTAPSSDSPMYRHPYYWQWPAQPSSSTSSPLNLCMTAHKSPNNYSPITPTSPVSPYFPTQAPMFPLANSSSLSPPTKKSKPLWYPWLNADSSKTKDSTHPHFISKGHQHSSNLSAHNHRNESLLDNLSQRKERTQVCCEEKNLSKPPGINHSIAGLLASSPAKSSPLKINKEALSSCETVSQFLGTVIDTAYRRHSNGRNRNMSKDGSNDQSVAQAVNSRPSSVPDRKKGLMGSSEGTYCSNGGIVSSWYQNQEAVYRASLKNHVKSPEVSEMPKVTGGPFSGIRKGEAERVRAMLQNEMILRGQFGLSPLKPSSGSSYTSNQKEPLLSSDSQSLTERLVSQLIKGQEPEKQSKEPVDAARGRKRTAKSSSTQKGGTGASHLNLTETLGSRRHSGSDERDGGGDEKSYGGKQNSSKFSEKKTSDLTIRPVSSPPSRKSVESNLQAMGLNSIQPPAAYCSNSQDLPERPMEHGGRVLKVESNRCSDVAKFPCSQQLVGVQGWRQKSFSRPGPHTQLLVEVAGLSTLEDSRQLRRLLEPDTTIVACPVRPPPARAAVVTWLRSKMAVVSSRLKHGELTALQLDTNLLPSGVAEKSVKFSQHPQLISPVKSAFPKNQAGTSRKSGDGSSQLGSPTCLSDVSTNDSSTLMDTDLDISCTPTQTPRLLHTQAMSQVPNSSSVSNEVSQKAQNSPAHAKTLSSTRTQSPTTPQTHFGKSKRRNIFASPNKTKEAKLSDDKKIAISTPLRRTSTELFDSSCTPIVPDRSSPCGMSQDLKSDISTDVDSQKTPLLTRVSTNTENKLKKNVLSSQTQRQFSELGFTAAEMSQIEGPTPKNSFGFKVTQNQMQGAKVRHKYQHVTTLSLELHVETRGDLRPDPELDPIQALFYSILDDVPADQGKRSITGVILVDTSSWNQVAARQQRSDVQLSQKFDSASSHSSQSPGKDMGPFTSTHVSDSSAGGLDPQPVKNLQSTPPSPRPTASSSPSPTPKKGKGRGRGKGGKTSARSPVRPGPSSKSVPLGQALLEKCSVGGDLEVTYVKDEMHLLGTLIDLVIRFDPDILVGFEIQMLSWGYLLQRAAHLGLELGSKIARVQDSKENNQFSAAKDEWGADHMSEIHVTGRVVLNLWRIIRHEVALNVYTFENVAFHILHKRIPLYSFRSLTKWFNNKTFLHRWRVIEHYIVRVKGQLEVIDSLDLIGKTSEFARVFGIEFYDVLARGTQIRVESMMLRLAKPLNYVPVSPSVNQRARQRAPECIPLTLEPESQLYTSPVVVLDFQSLYPSIMIAYNYCFSTCLGRLSCLENAHEGPFEFGCTSLKIPPATLKKIKDYVTISPNGVVFLKSCVRPGVLPRMVEEILNTRIMVKKSMKAVKDDKTLSRMLDARQLGLKLIANVTYGYTGASFSGRMPCIEVGDSIVRKARESLERAIELVRNTPRWGAQVVYGDTDSLFIHFPGRSKDEAFVLGHEIADAVTAMFPSPMKLKFEKVYLPCVLQTKKRYVGFMYETPDQKEPVYDAKGIETVRRDSCSAVAKILERSIKVLFSTHDLSRVREYVTRQLHKLLEGKVSVLDLIFAKEFRGSLGYKPGACVPALEIARRRLRVDRRWEPRVGERVPYVIVHGPPGLPLIQLVREPHDLTVDPSLRLNATYYISKQILPPLDRLFSLIGVNVFKWYQDMPKVVRVGPMMGVASTAKQGTISQFFGTTDCPVCEVQTKKPVCEKCAANPQLVTWTVLARLRAWERTHCRLMQVCVTCQGTQDAGDQVCTSTDCPVMFRRIIARQDLTRADNLRDVLNKYLH